MAEVERVVTGVPWGLVTLMAIGPDSSGMVEGYGVSSTLVERAINGAPVGVTITDPDRPDNPLVYVNDAFSRITGYEREEILGRNCRFLQGPETDAEAVDRLRAGIDAGEPVTVELLNYRADGEPFWNEVTVAPLHDSSGDISHFVGFQSDVTARKEAELALAERTDHLEHLIDRIDGLLQDVTEGLMQATSRQAGEQAVIDRIVGVEPYVFAWFAEPDRAAEQLVPSSWAGTGDSLDGVSVEFESDDPTARAYATDTVQTGPVAGTACADHVSGAAALAAAPITYGETTYGVLTVYADDASAFDGQETVVVQALGRTIGTGVNAAQSQRVLVADAVVELELVVASPSFFLAGVTAAVGSSVEYRGSVLTDDGAVSVFLEIDGDPEGVVRAARRHDEVAAASLVNDSGEWGLVECELVDGSLVSTLAELGAQIESMNASDGRATLTVELPAEGDPRLVPDRVAEAYPEVEVRAVRERQRRPTTKGEFVGTIDAALTDRQRTALERAFVSGYYDSDRKTTGEELAGMMGVSRATFHQHLRTAERKLITEFLDR